jgi:DNA-binding response OmpR family regulator
MSLNSLLVCSDDKTVRVLRRVLSDLEISVEHCVDTESAVHQLTRNRFEAVIVDCGSSGALNQVFRSVRMAACNKRAIAIAIVDAQISLKEAFEIGAHFVFYKPLSTERAKSSLRAARALMKRERRRNARLAVQMPVVLRVEDGAAQLRAMTTDLGEGGMALVLQTKARNLSVMHANFTLPGTEHRLESISEIAWEGPSRQIGIRFIDLAPESQDQLKSWLESRSPEFEKDDPPLACKLTDLSSAGCYVELASPFPIGTRVILSTEIDSPTKRATAVVRVMHPEAGMGLEFDRNSALQKKQTSDLISALNANPNIDLLVQPDGLDGDAPRGFSDDPLVRFFVDKADLPTATFRIELVKRRSRSATARA